MEHPFALLSGVLTLLGGWDVPLRTLAILNGVDLLSGIAKAVVVGQLDSRRCGVGIIRKFSMWLFIVSASALDTLVLSVFGQDSHLRTFVLLGWCLTEAISITENGRTMGLDVPPLFSRDFRAFATGCRLGLSQKR